MGGVGAEGCRVDCACWVFKLSLPDSRGERLLLEGGTKETKEDVAWWMVNQGSSTFPYLV